MIDFSLLTKQLLNSEIEFNVCELSPQYNKKISARLIRLDSKKYPLQKQL